MRVSTDFPCLSCQAFVNNPQPLFTSSLHSVVGLKTNVAVNVPTKITVFQVKLCVNLVNDEVIVLVNSMQ